MFGCETDEKRDIVAMGAKDVGKTTLLTNIAYGQPLPLGPTMSAHYSIKMRKDGGTPFQVFLHDAPGYRSGTTLQRMYYPTHHDGYLMMFDINNKESFQIVQEIGNAKRAEERDADVKKKMYLLGTKKANYEEKDRAVTGDDVNGLVTEWGCNFQEVDVFQRGDCMQVIKALLIDILEGAQEDSSSLIQEAIGLM